MTLLKEPLLHFAIGGAIVFAAYALSSHDRDNDAIERVTITEGDVRWMVETWRGQRLREPEPADLQAMIATLVEEELLAREALEMGLEEGDTVVRRRLAQKLAFLVEDTSRLVEPTESDLRAWHAEHQDRFRDKATVSFTQVFFNPSTRGDPEADATAMLATLGDDETVAMTLGDRLLIDGAFRDMDREAVSAAFGPDFAEAVFALTPGAWSGPLASGYGQHLVFVSEKTPGRTRSFEEARGAVVTEWWREQGQANRQEYMKLLRAKYPVEIEPAVQALLDGTPAPEPEQK